MRPGLFDSCERACRLVNFQVGNLSLRLMPLTGLRLRQRCSSSTLMLSVAATRIFKSTLSATVQRRFQSGTLLAERIVDSVLIEKAATSQLAAISCPSRRFYRQVNDHGHR